VAERSERRRRVAVLMVALVAAAATIATSPGMIQSRLDRLGTASVVLDGDTPRATGRFVLTLSAESLPVRTVAGPTPKGTVTFAVGAAGAGGGGASPNGPLQVTATAVGIPEPAQQVNGAPSWPIDQLCRVAEPCRREFEVAIEWLRPQAGSSVTVPVQASLQMLYDGRETLPGGATADWESGEFKGVPAAPGLTAKTDLGSTVLGFDSPMSARHVVLHGSAALLADPSAVDVSAYVRTGGALDQPPRAVVTLVPDEPDPAVPATPVAAGTFFQPFAGCPRGQACDRGFRIIARWAGPGPEDTVAVDWSFDALARFGGASGVPEGATLTAEVGERLDLGLASPRLQGRAEGSFDLQPAGDQRTGRVRLLISAPDMGNAFFGASPPAVAVVRLRAAVKDPGTPAKLRAWVTDPDHPGVTALALSDDGTELRALAFPLSRCPPGPTCNGYVEIQVDSASNREATISWDIAAELPVSRPGLAPGELRIEVSSGH
jgi:hypothetical protein